MNQVAEIDLRDMLFACLQRWWLILICIVLAASITFVYTDNFVDPLYRAEVSFYVNNSTVATNPNYSISSSDLATSQRLVLTYVNIIKSDLVLEKVVAASGLNITAGQLRGCMTAESMDETELFKVQVTYRDPKIAQQLANTIAEVAPAEIANVMVGSATKVIDYAKIPTAPYSPNVKNNVIIGGLIGAVVAITFLVIRTLMDVRIKCEEDILMISSVPILGAIPDFSAPAAEPYSFRKHDADTTRR